MKNISQMIKIHKSILIIKNLNFYENNKFLQKPLYNQVKSYSKSYENVIIFLNTENLLYFKKSVVK